jgi:hypothetical protein
MTGITADGKKKHRRTYEQQRLDLYFRNQQKVINLNHETSPF